MPVSLSRRRPLRRRVAFLVFFAFMVFRCIRSSYTVATGDAFSSFVANGTTLCQRMVAVLHSMSWAYFSHVPQASFDRKLSVWLLSRGARLHIWVCIQQQLEILLFREQKLRTYKQDSWVLGQTESTIVFPQSVEQEYRHTHFIFWHTFSRFG